jgi:hypothetical protein
LVRDDDEQWQRFWSVYPRKCAKKDARQAWAQLNPSVATVDLMVGALAWQTPHYRWNSDKADFAPYPATWLRAERWTDEQPAPVLSPSMASSRLTAWRPEGVQ